MKKKVSEIERVLGYKELPGRVILALFVAYEDFKLRKEIPDKKKLLENYCFAFKEVDRHIIIAFTAKRPDVHFVEQFLEQARGGETEFGVDITYEIDAETNSIKKYWFSR